MNYEITLTRIVDGDTIIADIDLGFDIILKSQTITTSNKDIMLGRVVLESIV